MTVTTDVNVFKFIHVTNKDVIWNYFSAQETYVWHAKKHFNATRIFELQLLQSCFPWCNLHAFTSLKGFCIPNVTISYQPIVVFSCFHKEKERWKFLFAQNLLIVSIYTWSHGLTMCTHKNHWIRCSNPIQVYKIKHMDTKTVSPKAFLKERVTLCSSGCSTHLCNTSSCYQIPHCQLLAVL